jgi:DNA (cytosine-5)-methyltransferase 1
MSYFFNAETGHLQRLREQAAFREDAWAQTEGGIIVPVPFVEEEPAEPVLDFQQASAAGLWLPAAPPAKPVRKLTCVSFFSGAGGFDLGFHQAGWRILAASDYDTACCWTYCFNLGTRPIQLHFITPEDRERFLRGVVKPSQKQAKDSQHRSFVELDGQDCAYFHRWDGDQEWQALEDATPHFFLGDVRKLTGEMVLEAIGLQRGEVDCVIGGPPCQGFSMAGKRDVMDPRNSLVFDYARRILEINPKTFVMENVPGILSMITPEGIPVMDAFCKILADGEYGDYEALKKALAANAQAWGVLRHQGMKHGKQREAPGASPEDSDEAPLQLSLFS